MTKLFLAISFLALASAPSMAEDTKPVALAKAVLAFNAASTDENGAALKAAMEAARCAPKSKAGMCILVRGLFPKL